MTSFVDCPSSFYENNSPGVGQIANVNIMGLEPDSFYLIYNGKRINHAALKNCNHAVHIVPRVLGGKGGFGSMLRAIGAQIEKTTNRDACRDLSGRRLRDINEEQRLKRWFAKQKQRDEEKAESKKKKLEKLRQICEGPALPKMEDKEYNRVRAEMSDAVFEAVEKGLEAPVVYKTGGNCTITSASSSSSESEETKDSTAAANESASKQTDAFISKASASKEAVKRKLPALKKTMFDEDLDSDVSSDSDNDANESDAKKIRNG